MSRRHGVDPKHTLLRLSDRKDAARKALEQALGGYAKGRDILADYDPTPGTETGGGGGSKGGFFSGWGGRGGGGGDDGPRGANKVTVLYDFTHKDPAVVDIPLINILQRGPHKKNSCWIVIGEPLWSKNNLVTLKALGWFFLVIFVFTSWKPMLAVLVNLVFIIFRRLSSSACRVKTYPVPQARPTSSDPDHSPRPSSFCLPSRLDPNPKGTSMSGGPSGDLSAEEDIIGRWGDDEDED
eukprot:3758700-Pyramimonas_sp.AAC.3